MQKKAVALWMVLCFLMTGCAGKQKIKHVEKQEFHMGTIITESVYGDKAEEAAAAVMHEIQALEQKMTINMPGSEIDRLNAESGKNWVTLSRDSMLVLQDAQRFAKLSSGKFNVSVGPLVKAWGIFTDHPRVPPQQEIDRLKGLVNYREILLDVDNSRAKLAREGQIVDLGGIAKGYAGDRAIEIYKQYGIKSAYVNLGGNVVVFGKKPDGTSWRVGVQNPRAANGRYIGVIQAEDKAIVSSGDYERYFEKDSRRYHHILDPDTGYPGDSGLIGTTIVSDVSMDADALSTATFLLGLEKGIKLVEQLEGVEAVFITKDKKVYVTEGLRGQFKFEDDSKEFEYVEKG